MKSVRIDGIYLPSEDIVAREIEGELILVPLIRGMGDMEEDLFSLNEEGKAIWRQLDGKRTLRQVVSDLRERFPDPEGVIERDVLGFVQELLNRKILVAAAPGPGSPGNR